MKNTKNLLFILFFACLIIYPFVAEGRWLAVGITFLIFSIVALSEDIVLGRAGMFDMGHAIYFGMGAYICGILNYHYGLPIVATIPFAIIIPALFGICLSAPIVHLRGDYLLVTTLGLNMVFLQVLENDAFGLTGGPNGIFGIDSLSVFGFQLMSQTSIYYVAFLFFIITLLIIKNLEHGKAGRAFHYLSQDPIASQSIGINVRFYRILAFALGAGIAGAAGVLFAIQYGAISPEAFTFKESVLFFAIVLVGGPSSIPGILIGTFVMFVLPEVFREFETARYLVFGLAMILAMVLRPNGILPFKFGNFPKFVREK
ncbi:branched-chain amino acid ABC transporter permease [Flexistipes sinusarabici]|uniref:Branched-chain amino acid ABC transporter permease n=1 Tax=Flexistipes sinusarabici TaxID=2352 RepID=A0A5D0MQT1_FLESI|nr:branched-chain amino acid ABC transporter permease [Flexistipes sinusarabici]TYB34080.1 MAG: branched-chain amino acid ABC transporter permease [Flexistipes sinusarabici]